MDNGCWQGSKAGRKGPYLSHLFFADDSVFVGKATCENCLFLKMTLDFFCGRSGQKVSQTKSSIFFSKNVGQNTREEIYNILLLPQTENLGKYLGIPLVSRKLKKQDCNFILDKVRTKLDGWKAKFFSMARRTVLATSILASVPNYYMQTTMLPSSVLSQLDRITRDFLWGSSHQHKKIHSVGWDKVTLSKSLGGLGIKSAKETNEVAMAKLNWRLVTERDKLWCQVLSSKYGIDDKPSPIPRNNSPVLNNIRKGNELFLKGVRWIPSNGQSISLWDDCWALDAPFRTMLAGPLYPFDSQLSVAEVFPHGCFQPNNVSYPLRDELLELIRATPIVMASSSGDSFTWKGSSNGTFSAATAYHIAKGLHHSQKGDWQWIWKTKTLPKIQQFIWLLSHERHKTFKFLYDLGITELASCPLCSAVIESCHHLFRRCPFVVGIWDYFFQGNNDYLDDDISFFQWF
ncbi:hypothetical protein SLA2020_065480 [Shorea laevis]